MILIKYYVREYLDKRGRSPYRRWLETLPVEFRARVEARVFAVERGNLGDFKSIGKGVSELRLHWSPGLRIYFAFEGREIILLLGGGTKGSQRRDIATAQARWAEYQDALKS
jgi:putative addiction module killer protein